MSGDVMHTVRDLLAALADQGITPSGVADDSRQVQPGDVFLAYPGDLADGRRFIPDALARGAVAVIWQPGGDFTWNPAWPVPQLSHPGLRPLAGPLAHTVHGFPSEGLSLIAITGTNGKTTISQCLGQVYPRPCAIIGTLGAGFVDSLEETGFTTPEATTLMRYLAAFRQHKAAACALEASSIGIEEGRMNGARVDVAVFTNFTRDHLDYHGSMEAYAAAKEKLFTWPRLRLAVINLDDELGLTLVRTTTANRIIGYTIGDGHTAVAALVRAEGLNTTPAGQQFTLVTPRGRAPVFTPLLGRYNVSNLLAVAAVLTDAGLDAVDVARRLESLTPPPGRLETLGGNGQPLIVVDYAHTPDALENALRALRPAAQARQGRLQVIFGCGGDRDPGKRPLMGEIACREADQVVITSDNPRSEDPVAIVHAIQTGAPEATIEVDRATAIRDTILAAAPQDVILLAGKGHEPYQEIAGRRLPFSDLDQAGQALAARNPAEEAR